MVNTDKNVANIGRYFVKISCFGVSQHDIKVGHPIFTDFSGFFFGIIGDFSGFFGFVPIYQDSSPT